LNQRPLGYEPNELPDCSTPHSYGNNHGEQGQTTARHDLAIEQFAVRRVQWLGSMPHDGTRRMLRMPETSHSAAKALRFRLFEPLLLLGFALTGVGTVLLGCILPRISAEWHLRDKDSGLLLLVQFACSASGALLVRQNLWKTLACGYGLFGAGAIGILLLQQKALPAFAVYGLGLGLAMTSTSMLTSRRFPQRKGAALAFLNFWWSAGSVACPILAARFLRHGSAGAAFGLVGVLALPFALLPLLAERGNLSATVGPGPVLTGTREVTIILYFALLAFLYVGVEASVGNWMSTYATRTTTWSFAASSLAVALFWAALLLGRAITPAVLIWVSELRLYRGSVVITIAGVFLLLSAHSPVVLLAASGLTGLALAPLFPLILALFLTEIGGSRNAGWVFAVAGLGGAVLSWLTGMVSSGTGSLRTGLLVPGAASLLMLALIILRRAPHGSGPDARQDALLEPTITG
jgi:MFS transporter, FHS family, glucose/mannose:H+ symporter